MLQSGFHRTLGDGEAFGNLFIGKTFENTTENLALAFREPRDVSCCPWGQGCRFHGALQELLGQPDFPAHDVADRLQEQARRIVFHENPGDTAADQIRRLIFPHPCRYQ